MHGLGPRTECDSGWVAARTRETLKSQERGSDLVTAERLLHIELLSTSTPGQVKKLEHRLSDSISRDIRNSSPALLSFSQMCAEE